jgi:VIT1/CCC1 family predicted Fe2+/Mn2+ transporter
MLLPMSEITSAFDLKEKLPPALAWQKKTLNPVNRISAVLLGLIMTLSFTCAISVAEKDHTDVRSMLFAIIGCNTAWALIEAVAYILTTLAVRGHKKTILDFIHQTEDPELVRKVIANALPPFMSSIMRKEDLESIRQAVLNTPQEALPATLPATNIKVALVTFFIIILAGTPVLLPFLFIQKVHLALRISNFIAIMLMFICGWLFGRYGGYNKLLAGFAMVVIGFVLVVITVALGG